MKNKTIRKLIEEAFREGYQSYETPCCPFNNEDDAWENSEAKANADKLRDTE